jgi:type I restriction enzyme R subunit
MNEAQTRAELIDPKLISSGWGVVEGSRILREYHLTRGRIQPGGRAKPLIVDYLLEYKGRKLAVIEAKSDVQLVAEGVAQAKNYAEKMHIDLTYATNGDEIYQVNMRTGAEGLVPSFPTPDQLWKMTFEQENTWRNKFNQIPFEDVNRTKEVRFYQELAVNHVMSAIAENKQRILLTMATGTGKTFIAFQIVWKLFHSRWNLLRDGKRTPRVLFLADRNILADQAFNAFSAFPEDALVRIKPDEIRKKKRVPKNGSVFFTIFQTFMSGEGDKEYFGNYEPDFFDFIIIDECHRGGANDEGNWRGIMEHFSPAVQLGLTATPKRQENADTYRYFGDPVYIYSLKQGIEDGFLTPFKVKRIQTTLDDYVYTSDDYIIEGEVESGRMYVEPDFNRVIEIKAREAKRVRIYLDEVNQKEKSIIFCATQDHALAVRDLVNQLKDSREPNYCVRVTANDGSLGDMYLAEFKDNEKTLPTVLTTSQKLSTGVDALNIRNIVLMRPVNSIIEFKQIIGRGTRLFEGKEYFTIYDFVNASTHFADPEWDGEPIAPEPTEPKTGGQQTGNEPGGEYDPGEDESTEIASPRMLKIKLSDGKEREIQHMLNTLYWSASGTPMSSEEFLQMLYGRLPEYYQSEEELRKVWSDPRTRKAFLEKLSDAGFGKQELASLQRMIEAENSDLLDVLEFVSYNHKPITREERVAKAQTLIFSDLDNRQKEFLEFVLSKYIETGVEELSEEKLPELLKLKYQALEDARLVLGSVDTIRKIFFDLQKDLYVGIAA